MGELIVCATPIGNLGDISDRVRAALASADVIAAEDTRRTLQLLNHLALRKPLISYYPHNRMLREDELLERARRGERIALVSDAGMPCISDPGEELVRRFLAEGVPVTVVPGPCAALVGLILSGFEMKRFVFEGFLPREGKERRARLAELVGQPRTVILYEAPHRVARTVADLAGTLGAERRIALCRELTKLHEERAAMPLGEATAYLEAHPPRGEYVLVLEGAREASPAPEENLDEALTACFQQGLELKEAVRSTCALLNLPRNQVYRRALELKQR